MRVRVGDWAGVWPSGRIGVATRVHLLATYVAGSQWGVSLCGSWCGRVRKLGARSPMCVACSEAAERATGKAGAPKKSV